jgi:hypothetical protein
MSRARIVIWSLGLCVSLCSACTPAPSVKQRAPLPEAETRSYRACQADSDCTWVQNGCCDCANGGADIAVHRDRARDFARRFDCEGAVCTTRGREPACGSGTAVCAEGLCAYRELAATPNAP